MDIRIVAIESQPPQWRVYLNSFFIVCHSEAEAQETAQRALVSTRQPFRAVYPCNMRHQQRTDTHPTCAP